MTKPLPPKTRRATVANAPTSAAPATITSERVARSIRARFDPLPSLNPRLLAQYLQQFEYGYLEPAARVFDAMERRDDRLASVAAKAKSALARLGFEVLVDGGAATPAQQAEARRHQAALEYLYGHCTATNAVREDETGGFSLLIRQMADAIGKRYSVHEIVWEPGEGGLLTATFRHAPLWFFEAVTGKLRFKPQEGAAEGVPMDPDAWLVTVGDGIMEACAVLWMFKHLPLRDWLAYSEKFGMPYLLGKTAAAFNSAEWNAMAAALRGFGSDGAAVVGGADDIVPVQAGGNSQDLPFAGLVERSDRAMSILWRGADLGTQSHGGAGRGQGASLQEDETAALDEDRAAWLTESLLPVSRTAIRYLFGPGTKPLAYVRVKFQVRRDIQLDLAVDAFLLNNGAPISLADALERYGRPTPGPGEPLLHPASGGGAKGAASEVDTEASLERAANQGAPERVAAENFNPNHGKDGRFTTGKESSGDSKKADDLAALQHFGPNFGDEAGILKAPIELYRMLKGAYDDGMSMYHASQQKGINGPDGMPEAGAQATGLAYALSSLLGLKSFDQAITGTDRVSGAKLSDQEREDAAAQSLATLATLHPDLLIPESGAATRSEAAASSLDAGTSAPAISAEPAASGVNAGTSELGNALSGLGTDPLGRNLNTLDQFGPGAGFSGVYDVDSGKFLAYPSGDGTTLLNGDRPANLVDQLGGHVDVNSALSDLLGTDFNNRWGFSMTLDQDGNLATRFNSTTINSANPNSTSRTVPVDNRQSILDAITNYTGRRAYSAQ